MKNKTKIIVIAVPIILLVLILGVTIPYSILHLTETTVVATVNGEDIYAGEVKLQMTAQKSAAVEYFDENFNAEVNANFWDTDFDGQTPAQYLRNKALEEVKRDKLQLQLGKKYGLCKDLSYKAFVNEVTSINNANSEKIAKSQAVYGQSEYSLSTYYEYRLSNLQLDLQKIMSEQGEPLYADEAAYKKYYEKYKDKYYKKIDTSTFLIFSVAVELDSEESRNKAKDELESAKKILDSTKDITSAKESILKQYKSITASEINLDNENYSQLSKQNSDMYDKINELEKGKSTDVFQNSAEMKLCVCLSRKSAGYEKYEDVKSTLKAQYSQTAYSDYVDELCEKYKAEANSSLDKIPVKQAIQ